MKKKFGGNVIGNDANQKSTTLPRPDDSGHYLQNLGTSKFSYEYNPLVAQRQHCVRPLKTTLQ